MNFLSNREIKEIIAGVEKLSDGHLYQKNDLEILIEKAIAGNNVSSLEELAFNAKFTVSLLKIIQKKEPSNDEAFFKKALIEFNEYIQKIKNNINELLQVDEFLLKIFSQKYLLLNQQCLTNLNNLCNDLGYLKLYLNDLKREG